VVLVENHQILFQRVRVLAGQLFPIGCSPTRTGRVVASREGGTVRVSWLTKRGTGGFSEWDSKLLLRGGPARASHLADLAESQPVYELAAGRHGQDAPHNGAQLVTKARSGRRMAAPTHPHIKGGAGRRRRASVACCGAWAPLTTRSWRP